MATPQPGSGSCVTAGIKFILETCSSLFNYAQRNRHLSPYAENPFRTIEVSRMPVEDFRAGRHLYRGAGAASSSKPVTTGSSHCS